MLFVKFLALGFTAMIDHSRHFLNPAVKNAKALSKEWRPSKQKGIDLAKRLFERCLANSEPARGSLHSLYCGDLGPTVYLRWRMSVLLRDAEPARADTLLQEALERSRTAVAYEERRSSSSLPSRVTLLEGPLIGAKALHAVLLKETGQRPQAVEQATQLIELLHDACRALPPSECDVLYGRAGALQTIFFLRKELGEPALRTDVVVALAKQILSEGRRYATKHHDTVQLPLLWKWHDSKYLGAAHGVVGILHVLLSLREQEWAAVNEHGQDYRAHVRETIRKLSNYCWPSGNLDSSIGERHATDRLVHWCHGAPGHVLLLVKAAVVFEDGSFLNLAKDVANEVIWPRGLLRKGVGLCHG
jgi:hypothetical protein